MATPKHRMTLEQYYQIIGWLQQNKHRIHASDLSQPEICIQAQEGLGFVVPITSIQKCGKIAKIKWPKSPVPPAPVPIDREAIIILIGAIHGLYIEKCGRAPDDLENLKSTYVREQAEQEEIE